MNLPFRVNASFVIAWSVLDFYLLSVVHFTFSTSYIAKMSDKPQLSHSIIIRVNKSTATRMYA